MSMYNKSQSNMSAKSQANMSMANKQGSSFNFNNKNDGLMSSFRKRAQLVKSALLGGGNMIETSDFSSYADVRERTREFNKANQTPINPAEEDFVEEDHVEPPHSVFEVIVAITPENIPLLSSTNDPVKCFSVNLRGRKMKDKHCQFVQEAFTLLHRSIETSSPFKSTLPPNVSSPALQNEVDYYGSTDVLIRTMDVGYNFLTAHGLRVFMDTVALSREGEQGTPQTALKIRLDHNSLDDESCEYLAEIIKNPNSRLQSLDLSFNKGITDKGVAILCRALIAQQVELDTEQQPIKLKSLALVATGMTDAGLRCVLEAATINRHIHRLDCHRLRSTTEENPLFLDTHLLGELLTYMRRNRGEQIEYAISARDVPINDARPDIVQSHTEKLIERSNPRLMSYQVMCSENGWRVERDVLESQIRRLLRENMLTKMEIESLQKTPVSRIRKADDTPVNIKQQSEVESLVDPAKSELIFEDEPVATNAPHKIKIVLNDNKGRQVDFGGQEFDINLLHNNTRLHRDHYKVTVVDNFDGTYDLTYALEHLLDKGKYELSICIAALDASQRKHIQGSPVPLNVVNGPVPKLCQLTPMQESSVRYGKELRYTVQLQDRNGLPVDIDQDGRAGNPSFQLFANRYDSFDPYRQELKLETQRIALDREHGSGEHLSGTYELSFIPDKPGMYVIDVLGRDHVTGGHEHLIGSPHLITVHPLAFGPLCRARGPALSKRQLRGSHKYFTIYAMDRDGNHVRTGGDKFTAVLKNKETNETITGAVRSPIDYNNGTYRVDLELDIINKLTVGEYDFHVDYIGQTKMPIFGSPFTVFMHSDDKFCPDQSSLDLDVGNMYEGLTHFFRIKCKNEKGQPIDVDHKKTELIVKVTPPQGDATTYKSTQISEFDAAKGELVLKWRPPVHGKYVLQIQMEDQRRGVVNVANCPFTFNVKAAVEAPSNTFTRVEFSKNERGSERTLYVMTRNHMNKPIGKGGDHVVVIVRHVNSGDEMHTRVKDLRNGSYQCNFNLVFGGEYQVLVVINDQPPLARQCVF